MKRLVIALMSSSLVVALTLASGCTDGDKAENTPTAPPSTTTPQQFASPTATVVKALGDSTPTPSMRALIEQEKARQQALGLTLKDPLNPDEIRDIAGTFDGVSEHWVALYTVGDMKTRLVIYERQGDSLVPLLTRDTTFIHLWQRQPEQVPALIDINGDGLNELVVSEENGGNCWECGGLGIYTVDDHEALEVPTQLPVTGILGMDQNGDGTSAIVKDLEDVDGDGIYELIALDTSWELHWFAHSDSPTGHFVLAWDGERYVDAPARFPAYFQHLVGELEKDLANLDSKGETGCQKDEDVMTAAISMLLEYGHSGRAQEGWGRYHELAQPGNLETQWWRDALPVLEEDLQLSVPKNGQAPARAVQPTPSPIGSCYEAEGGQQ